MRRTALSLAALGVVAASCGVLPDDHALQGALGRSTRRAVDGVVSVGRSVETGTRRLASLSTTVAAAPGATARELQRLQAAGTQFVTVTERRLHRAVPRIRADLDEATGSGARRLRSLTGAPAQIGADLGYRVAGLRNAVVSTPTMLRLDRTPMPTADDPERTVEIDPTSRRRSWLERALDRMSF